MNWDFQVRFHLDGQGQSTPKWIGIVTKVFFVPIWLFKLEKVTSFCTDKLGVDTQTQNQPSIHWHISDPRPDLGSLGPLEAPLGPRRKWPSQCASSKGGADLEGAHRARTPPPKIFPNTFFLSCIKIYLYCIKKSLIEIYRIWDIYIL